MLDVHSLSVRYGPIHALKGVSLQVHEGEIVALIGANGAGKSTLLNALSGIVSPAGGRVLFRGADISGRPAHKISRAGLVQVPEGRAILTTLTVRENLMLGAFGRTDRGR